MPEKEELYSNLVLEDADYMHAKAVRKKFSNKNLGEYHDLYLKSDTLLLADVFGNSKKKFLKIYKLDPLKFLTAARLVWLAALKKSWSKIRKLELLTNIDKLSMFGKGIRGWICSSIIRYTKATKKCMKVYDRNKKLSYLNYWDVNN